MSYSVDRHFSMAEAKAATSLSAKINDVSPYSFVRQEYRFSYCQDNRFFMILIFSYAHFSKSDQS